MRPRHLWFIFLLPLGAFSGCLTGDTTNSTSNGTDGEDPQPGGNRTNDNSRFDNGIGDTFHQNATGSWEPVNAASVYAPYFFANLWIDNGTAFAIYDAATENTTMQPLEGKVLRAWGGWDGSRAVFIAEMTDIGGLQETNGWTVFVTWTGWHGEWSVTRPASFQGVRVDGLAVQEDGRMAVLTRHPAEGTWVWESPNGEEWTSMPVPGWNYLNVPAISVYDDGWALAGRDQSGRIVVLEGRDGIFTEMWFTLPDGGTHRSIFLLSHTVDGTPLLAWTNVTLIGPGNDVLIEDFVTYAATADGKAVYRLDTKVDQRLHSIAGNNQKGWILTQDNPVGSPPHHLHQKTGSWTECHHELLEYRMNAVKLWRLPQGDYFVGKSLDADENVALKGISLGSLCA